MNFVELKAGNKSIIKQNNWTRQNSFEVVLEV